ncbi:MAG TPA: AGE family epimerase/isomerase [Opitutaceae bacterium]|jgi:mannobiose 2-epimerase|nr:AGE family epimerase/isomerase [Opitutaceae bacterium]
MNPAEATDYLNRIEDDLRHNILPFWIEKVANRETKSFVASLTNDLEVDATAERGALLTSRILWTYSAAYIQFGDPDYLAMAELAYEDLSVHFEDKENGGYWWSIAADGTVTGDRKQVYGQAFAIYALTEFHVASGKQEALDKAVATYRLVEKHARANHGGYLEAFSRTWQPIPDMRLSEIDMNEPKSQNTHLHVMEAYSRLLVVWPDTGLRKALAELLQIMLVRILNPKTGHLGLFFSEDWKPKSDRISYGHDIEAAWLLMRAAESLGEPAIVKVIRPLALRIAEATLDEGVDEDGGVYNQGAPHGLITDSNKEWWPQAEAVIGFIDTYQHSGEEKYLNAAFKTWNFIELRLIDHMRGEWFRGVTKEGEVLDTELKVSFWKCPYHNGRTGLEATRRLRSIIEKENSKI